MPFPKKIIGVYQNNQLIAKGDCTEIASYLKITKDSVARIARKGRKHKSEFGDVYLRYIGEVSSRKGKPVVTLEPVKMPIKDVVKAARQLGISYGKYVARERL